MTLSVPPAVNYQSPLIAVPTRWDQSPPEGSKIIPCEVDWGAMGGSFNCVSFNLQNNATLNFSQIVALSIDNSACGSDIKFIFPDTSETLAIPAYAPKTIVPVFTNQTQFWLSCPFAQSEDITRFSILNSMTPPIAVPTTQEQTVAVISDIAAATTNVQLVPTTVNGTLENASISFSDGGTLGSCSWKLQDGNANALAGGTVGTVSGAAITALVYAVTELRVRFQGGIVLVMIDGGATGVFDFNLYYRTP